MKTIRSNPKPKTANKKILIKKADTVFSKYIRTKYQSNYRFLPDTTIQCYTCGRTYPYEKMQCGHYESRSYHSLRFDECNARVQCYGCNCAKSGNYKEYTRRLIDEIGIYGVDQLKLLRQDKKIYYVDSLQNVFFTDLNEVIKYYENKLKNL